jgi:hypothetical protein
LLSYNLTFLLLPEIQYFLSKHFSSIFARIAEAVVPAAAASSFLKRHQVLQLARDDKLQFWSGLNFQFNPNLSSRRQTYFSLEALKSSSLLKVGQSKVG